MLGPPDKAESWIMHWLIVPGPPVSCHLVFFPPMPATKLTDFYHAHPTTWSIHIVLEGTGYYYADGKRHELRPGSVMYHGPGVPHCGPFPYPETAMQVIVIQHPGSGHKKGEWVVVPEAGLADHPGDRAAFVAKYGELADATAYIDPFPDLVGKTNPSDRWLRWVMGKMAKDEPK